MIQEPSQRAVTHMVGLTSTTLCRLIMGPVAFSGLTENPNEVTCPGCLEAMASAVEGALDPCRHHGKPKPREECDVCMQRGTWGDV